ncbi:conserved hypothetical protein [Kineococcus radiotolerans SRS30216 = ATCC BAA-149]|uniref:Uncharacterized protein n=1 Tax=Kineococcus radiotolerans (strain ATCC BAA-149 / DSM 14245 / SRS30216) TaxID=266940 RepID=A6W9P8_KINRD|nr:conserved hypothetical protein [Kineococcus radiotolerans SRS30216 = ATCC BAA-149]
MSSRLHDRTTTRHDAPDLRRHRCGGRARRPRPDHRTLHSRALNGGPTVGAAVSSPPSCAHRTAPEQPHPYDLPVRERGLSGRGSGDAIDGRDRRPRRGRWSRRRRCGDVLAHRRGGPGPRRAPHPVPSTRRCGRLSAEQNVTARPAGEHPGSTSRVDEPRASRDLEQAGVTTCPAPPPAAIARPPASTPAAPPPSA